MVRGWRWSDLVAVGRSDQRRTAQELEARSIPIMDADKTAVTQNGARPEPGAVMTSNIYWEPERPRKGKALDTQLKFVLRERFDFPIQLDSGNRDYFLALTDANVKDADKIVEAIDTHGEIRIWEEW